MSLYSVSPSNEQTCIRILVHSNLRKVSLQTSLTRIPPTSEEAEALHNLYLRYGSGRGVEGTETVWMENTELENCLLMFPQERKCVPYMSFRYN